jgi:hypothetical protein
MSEANDVLLTHDLQSSTFLGALSASISRYGPSRVLFTF